MSQSAEPNTIPFDLIGDILDTLRFRSSIFFHSQLAAPWGASFQPVGLPRFHIALAGNFVVGSSNSDRQEIIEIQQGDIALLPTGDTHWIADQAGSELMPSEEMSEACKLDRDCFQKGDITHRIMCGIVHYDQQMGHPIFDSLAEILHFSDYHHEDSVWTIIQLIDQEIRQSENHTTPIVDRLTEALFIKLIDTHLHNQQDSIGFIGALHDPRIHKALSLMHQQPAIAWSLESLSERGNMSSSTLNRHFQKALGLGPISYLSNWRMIKAHKLIKHSEADLERVAELVGFSSARSLSKAFQRHYHCTPSELRDQQRRK